MSLQKLILFDVDRTLVTSSSAHRDAFTYAVKSVFGVDPRGTKVNFHGMSDTWIVTEVARARSISEERIAELLKPCLSAMTNEYIRTVQNDSAQLLPGVADLLDALKHDNHLLGLITGNLQPIAFAKLGKLGIADMFTFGGFGSDALLRADMLAVALKNARSHGFTGSNTNVWVVGDTPNDINAANANDVRCLAVATGAFSVEILQNSGATCVCENLQNTNAVFDILMS